jgi:hypothetical protein
MRVGVYKILGEEFEFNGFNDDSEDLSRYYPCNQALVFYRRYPFSTTVWITNRLKLTYFHNHSLIASKSIHPLELPNLHLEEYLNTGRITIHIDGKAYTLKGDEWTVA